MKRIFIQISCYCLAFVLLFSSCGSRKNSFPHQENTISSIRFLSEYIMPEAQVYQHTLIGGLSGMDYDPGSGQYYFISDDPSQFSPARFYTGQIKLSGYKIDTVLMTGLHFLLQENGTAYPKYEYGKNLKADAESIRYNPISHQLIWSNEGERLFRPTDTTLVQPALTYMSTTGKFLDTIPLPEGFHITKAERGVRKNAFFEGLTFADHYKTLYASLEEPRYEDGKQADFEYDKALTRILKFDVATGKNTAQYAYNLDAIPVKPSEANSWNINGISEILAINDHTLIVMERAWVKGHDDHSFIKLYLVDLNGAENEIHNTSFTAHPPKALKKKLLFNFDSLNRHIDNFEGMTFGPDLPNGHKSLIFCVDDNFSKTETAQFFLFEVMP